MFLLDTNFLIYYRAGRLSTVNFMEENKNSIFYITTIVIAEFLSYPLIDQKTISQFNDLLKVLIIVNLDETIARYAAELRRKQNIKLYDAIIAASAIITNSTLLTYNIKDFKKIKELKMLAP